MNFFDLLVCSCNMKLNLDYMLERLWELLDLIRVYTKKPGGTRLFMRLCFCARVVLKLFLMIFVKFS